MMDEDILRANESETGGTNACRIILVFKKTELELFIDRTNLFINRTRYRNCKHRQHPDVELSSSLRVLKVLGEMNELSVGQIRGLDLSLVTRPIRYRPDRA